LFGFELQTNGNVFIEGVKDREVAYEHKLMTLEGDETLRPGAESELEFVTAKCANLDDALRAVEAASNLAKALAERVRNLRQVSPFVRSAPRTVRRCMRLRPIGPSRGRPAFRIRCLQ
jgi:hypothetical protein